MNSLLRQSWLYAPSFDLVLIIGVLMFALVLGGLATQSPSFFIWVIYFNFWLLAPSHLMSTFTRIAFDRASRRRYWFLLIVLPPLVLIATASLTWFGGVIALNTLYFCWQTWHYTRQSHGIARSYRRTALPKVRGHDRLTESVIFGFSAWGLLYRASLQPVEFFGHPIWCIALPPMLVMSVGAFALTALAWWMWRQLSPAADTVPGVAHALFVLSHVGITVISYVVVADITYGWLFINLWHNAQYLLFVWANNRKRYSDGIDPARHFISWLCQPGQYYYYALMCAGLGVVLYYLLGQAARLMTWQMLPLAFVFYQAIAFHHYLVDSVIWRSPQRQSLKY